MTVNAMGAMSAPTPGVEWRRVACPLCAADRPRVVVVDRLPFGGDRLEFRIGRCTSCGLHYVIERAVSQSLGNQAGGAARRDAARANLPIYEAGLAQLTRAGLRPGDRILDVGCARGDFLAYAAERGFHVSGIDLNPALAEESRSRGFDVRTGDVRAIELAQAPDAITMWDVIEHVDDPVAVLSACAQIVAPGGLVLFHTGNARFQIPKARLLTRLSRRGGPYLIPQQHLTHWDPVTATLGLEKAGLVRRRIFFAGTLHYREAWKRAVMGSLNVIGRAPALLGRGLYTSSMGVIGQRPT